ncbi:MAG: helix-turn-helix domain-containing protein [Rhodopseudomonas sp.]|nr:helix-turn-helix domain-containing protein [Rhodopseudomonas sp.]
MSYADSRENQPCPFCAAEPSNICRILREGLNTPDGSRITPIPFQTHQVAARRLIWREREPVPHVPAICQGWAASVLTLSDGRRQILSFLLPGDLVSAALVYDPVSPYSVEAITDVRYNGFDRAAFKAALADNPALIGLLSAFHGDESSHADQLAVDLGQRDAAERIARLIFNLSERLLRRGLVRHGTPSPELTRGAAMDFPLRQHHIADATGLTVVHAGKVLNELRRGGLIEIGDRTLMVTDPDGLRRVADMY